ncbi:MAG TPA: lipoyl(octanoyl) transferase LipB [Candidatus Acidoferrales bacterium]|nr:lipoyl(octanoyl) transferase LipB [Candidatus Acidoferrales bacterium]
MVRLAVPLENKTCWMADWGLAPYGRILALQREFVAARKAGRIPDVLLLGEHTPVITLGRNARRENLLLPEEELARRGVELHETDRGGDVTYHGPGQLVGYPILDLTALRKDVVWYVRSLEEVLISAARSFGLEAARRTAPEGEKQLYTGVWVGDEKLAAIGVRISRWVTSHGFAFNATTNLSHFDFIIPCGIRDKGVTSLEKQVPRLRPDFCRDSARDDNKAGELMVTLKAEVVRAFGEVFDREMRETDLESLEGSLAAQQAAAS